MVCDFEMRQRRQRGRSVPHPVLPKIPEALDQTGPEDLTIARSASFLSKAETPRSDSSNEHDEAPAQRKEWPVDREVRGRLTLRASADHKGARCAMCSVRGGVLSLSVESVATPASRGASSTTVLTQVPVEELAVGLQRGRENMFTIATLHRGRMYDEIYCFADDQVKRNKWIAVFRRMGVSIFDVTDGMDASLRVSAPPLE